MNAIASPPASDSAAVFAAAKSLWEACEEAAKDDPGLDLSEVYNGYDQLMREVMRIAALFESWACEHIDFERIDDVWPYLLDDSFGRATLRVVDAGDLATFSDQDCLRVALVLRLPVKLNGVLPVPVNIAVPNSNTGSAFIGFRIQTARACGDEVIPFTHDDDPFDPECGSPFFGLYGVHIDASLEHIADRSTYAGIIELLDKIFPGGRFASLASPSTGGTNLWP